MNARPVRGFIKKLRFDPFIVNMLLSFFLNLGFNLGYPELTMIFSFFLLLSINWEIFAPKNIFGIINVSSWIFRNEEMIFFFLLEIEKFCATYTNIFIIFLITFMEIKIF